MKLKKISLHISQFLNCNGSIIYLFFFFLLVTSIRLILNIYLSL